MSRVPTLFLILKVWFIFISSTKSYEVDLKTYENYRRELISETENFINIDCGAPTNYTDIFGRYFESDTNYVDTGEVSQISPNYMGLYWSQLTRLRSFPQGKKNCYVLRPKQGKNVDYLISFFFVYGNYDGRNTPPTFDLYIGVNYWETIRMGDSARIIFSEIVHVPTTDTIEVCLVNTNLGVPFISALQLRPLINNSIYQVNSFSSQLNKLVNRYDCGRTPIESTIARYQDDVYDRIWSNDFPSRTPVNTSQSNSIISVYYTEQPPAAVLSSAIQSLGTEIRYNFTNGMPNSEFLVYLHFAEVVQSAQGQRNFTITINGVTYGPYSSPDYLKTSFFIQKVSAQQGAVQLSILATPGSQFPPILNALEIFQVIQLLDQLPTDPEDVSSLLEFKRIYGVTEDWQGDPCVPTAYPWSRLTCNSDNPPRIISLNLSSSGLTGNITASLSNLKFVQELDLSYNQLTGSIPESLAELPSLVFLNLAGNKLEGSVPKALLEKSKTGALNLRLHDNPKLCFPDPCKQKKNKTIIIIVVVVGAPILVGAIVILLVYLCKPDGRGGKFILVFDIFIVLILLRTFTHFCFLLP
ncbi:Malectin-like carbohydrate-binding domain containing protein [Trema orientale]|uniref:Malectin-like carbohydrate-binding domain containing protein n=1 Tax=Trema orientale TaxID=63057 RepID=A0A2P5FJ72_TREOI|nr:Malectin-like carbohydrate-binding domain containing protein [Trema orientale]